MSGSSSHAQRGAPPEASRKTNTGTRLSAEVEHAVSTDGQRHGQARELDLAHEVLAVDQAAHRPRRSPR